MISRKKFQTNQVSEFSHIVLACYNNQLPKYSLIMNNDKSTIIAPHIHLFLYGTILTRYQNYITSN